MQALLAVLIQDEHANLGIVCGPASGVFVLDQDGEQGPQSLLLRELPPTVKTGSGRHYYFALPSDTQFKNAVGFLPGLDLRTTGGQVVVPPCQRCKVRVGHHARTACPRASRHRHSL